MLRQYFSALIIPGPEAGPLGSIPLAESPLGLFPPASPKLFSLSCLAFPTETLFKAGACVLPSSCLL